MDTWKSLETDNITVLFFLQTDDVLDNYTNIYVFAYVSRLDGHTDFFGE